MYQVISGGVSTIKCFVRLLINKEILMVPQHVYICIEDKRKHIKV